MKKRIYFILAALIVIIPLGLLSDSPAWGEWGKEYYKKILGYIPYGIAKAKGINAPMKDYSFGSLSDISGYYLSAIVGAVLIFAFFYILTKVLHANNS